MPLPDNLICLGASAGGLQAVTDLLHAIPADINDRIAVVLAQHLSPTYKSRLSDLLSRETELQVVETTSDEKLAAGRMYVCPPDREIYIEGDTLLLTRSPIGFGPKPSVDSFLSSVTLDWAKKTVAVILSGTGSDGSHGIQDLSDRGGIVMVQHPESAKYDGMPQAAISTKLIDFIGTPKEIGNQINDFVETGQISKPIPGRAEPETGKDTFHQILNLLSQRTGTDFSNYKSATVNRRLEKRLSTLQIISLEDYVEYCHKNPKEIDLLFDSLLISVTEFFRDDPVFDKLQEILRKRFKKDNSVAPIRIWTPGCATGEESYTIAMIMTEILGSEVAQKRVQIFASDIDATALQTARSGTYSADKLEKIPEEYRKYLKRINSDKYQVSQDIKSCILFSTHDVTANPPFLKLDLISCRNLLIYFGLELQKHVLPVFHYSLKDNGLLLLGKSETTGDFQDYYTAIDGKNKIYSKKRLTANLRKKNQTIQLLSRRDFKAASVVNHRKSLKELVQGSFFSQSVHPVVVINEEIEILEIIGDINDFVKIKSGQMTSNLVQQAIEELQIEMKATISKVISNRSTHISRFRKVKLHNIPKFVRIIVKPVQDDTSSFESLMTVEFESIDVDELGLSNGTTKDDNEDNNQRIIVLEKELSATKEDLQSYVEELETANEELQSLNEELQSSNEEMQSTNEELETSNEELQSTNEEVQIAYNELSELNKILIKNEDQLISSQQQLNALLENTMQVYLLVSSDYRIITFNKKAVETFKELFGKVPQADKYLPDYFNDDMLPFYQNFKRSLKGKIIKEDLRVINQDGKEKSYFLNLHPVHIEAEETQEVVIGLLDVTDKVLATQALTHVQRLNQSIYSVIGTAIIVSDKNQKIVEVNDSFSNMLGYEKNQAIGNHINLIASAKDRRSFEKRYQHIYQTGKTQGGLLSEANDKNGDTVIVKTQSSVIDYNDEKLIVTSIDNITEISNINQKLEEQKASLDKIKYALEERIKEQNSILNIALLANTEVEAQQILKDAVELIQNGFQYPNIVGVSIRFGSEKFETKNYKNRKNNHLKTAILVEDKKVGSIDICYQQHIEGSYPVFLNDEVDTITAIGNLLSQILENKKLNEEVSYSENFLQSTIASIQDGILIIDNDGNHVMVNEALAQITGFSKKELLSSSVPHLYWPEENYSEIQSAFDLTKAGSKTSHELVFKTREGRRFSVLVSPSKIEIGSSRKEFYLWIIKRLTEKTKGEIAPAPSESDYQFLKQHNSDLVTKLDAKGNYLEVSPSSERIVGYTPDELIGKSIIDFWHKNDLQKFQDLQLNNSSKNTTSVNVDYRFRHKNGHFIQLHSNNMMFFDAKIESTYLLSTSRNVNVLKI